MFVGKESEEDKKKIRVIHALCQKAEIPNVTLLLFSALKESNRAQEYPTFPLPRSQSHILPATVGKTKCGGFKLIANS